MKASPQSQRTQKRRHRRMYLYALCWLNMLGSTAQAQTKPQPASLPKIAQASASLSELEQREQALLQKEYETLNALLVANQQRERQTERELTLEIESLTEKLYTLQVQNKAQELSLIEHERSQRIASDSRLFFELFAQLLSTQSNASLKDQKTSDQINDAVIATLPTVIDTELSAMRSRHQIRMHPQTYFDNNAQTKGPVLEIGQLSKIAFQYSPLAQGTQPGQSSIQSTALTQRRGGFWETSNHMAAHIFNTNSEEMWILPQAFLLPSSAKHLVAKKINKGWLTWFSQGGFIMYVLLTLSIAGFIICCEKLLLLTRIHRSLNALTPNRQPSKHQWWLQALNTTHHQPQKAKPIFQQTVIRIQKRLNYLTTIAGVSPLLGLLGTVSGLIDSFAVLSTTTATEPKLLAGGISLALITTQFGLTIAVPTTLAYALLKRYAVELATRLEFLVKQSMPIQDVHSHPKHSVVHTPQAQPAIGLSSAE